MGDDKQRRLRLLVTERERLGRETATLQRLEKLPVDAVETLPDQRQRITTGPIERMLRDGHLHGREYNAAQELRRIHHASAISGGAQPPSFEFTTSKLRHHVPSAFAAQSIADARGEWRDLQKAFKRESTVWVVLMMAVINEDTVEVVGRVLFGVADRRENRAAGRGAIKASLAALADHLGI